MGEGESNKEEVGEDRRRKEGAPPVVIKQYAITLRSYADSLYTYYK